MVLQRSPLFSEASVAHFNVGSDRDPNDRGRRLHGSERGRSGLLSYVARHAPLGSLWSCLPTTARSGPGPVGPRAGPSRAPWHRDCQWPPRQGPMGDTRTSGAAWGLARTREPAQQDAQQERRGAFQVKLRMPCEATVVYTFLFSGCHCPGPSSWLGAVRSMHYPTVDLQLQDPTSRNRNQWYPRAAGTRHHDGISWMRNGPAES